jgi:hypothetical protein
MSLLKKLLGRSLEESERSTVPSLTELTPSLLDEARLLARQSPIAAMEYLKHYVVSYRLDEATEFLDEVLLGAMDPAHWAMREYFCAANTDWGRLLRLDSGPLLAPIASLGEVKWYRLVPAIQRWPSDNTGAPGQLVQRRYDWNPQPGISVTRFRTPPIVEELSDLRLALARWLASRIAWELRADLSTQAGSLDCEKVARHFRIESAELSGLAVTSIDGLSRELVALGWPVDEIPGFRGHDEWYALPTVRDKG